MLKTAFGAWLGFFAIGLVLWGIYTGKFSPTEAAGVTVGFCIIAGSPGRCRCSMSTSSARLDAKALRRHAGGGRVQG
jgi:TRAP-type C4-dicarboxylate transport system permease large subunit